MLPPKKKPRRRPDGQPEFRSIDEMLASAVNSEEFKTLPNAGKPLDLGDYFSSGAEHRMAGKLLKDSHVLPQPLQERRDAEHLQLEAEQYLTSRLNQQNPLLEIIRKESALLSAPFPHREALQACLNLETWPDYLAEPAAKELPALRLWVKNALALQEKVVSYNRRIEVTISTYMGKLQKADACIERLNKQVVFSRHLTPSLQMRPIKLSEREADMRQQLKRLPLLPDNLKELLQIYHRQVRPRFWQRLSL